MPWQLDSAATKAANRASVNPPTGTAKRDGGDLDQAAGAQDSDPWRQPLPGPSIEERRIIVVRELIAGTSLVAVCGLAGTVLFAEPAGQVLVVAVGCAVCAARCTDWLARVGIAALAALIYVMFAAHQSGAPAPWSYTPVIGLATILGAGYRRITHADDGGETERR